MIIECPSCKTRFSVDAEQIAAVENPQFHCSRCDYMFAPGESAQKSEHTFTEKSLEISPEHEKIYSSSPSAKQQGLAFDDFEESYYESDESYLMTADWPEEDSSNEYQSDISYAQASRHKILQAKKVADEKTDFIPEKQAENILNVFQYSAETQKLNKLEKKNQLYIDQSESFNFPPKNPLKDNLNLISPFEFTSWTWIPITLTLPLVILIFSVISLKSPDIIPQELSKKLNLNSDNLNTAAPLSMHISRNSAQNITLHDGNHVFEISGILENKHNLDLDNLMIESRIYDKANHELGRKIVNLRNGLINARLEALSRESIANLQEKSSLGNQLLKSGNTAPLRVVFTEPISEVAKYSLRVYSSKELKNS